MKQHKNFSSYLSLLNWQPKLEKNTKNQKKTRACSPPEKRKCPWECGPFCRGIMPTYSNLSPLSTPSTHVQLVSISSNSTPPPPQLSSVTVWILCVTICQCYIYSVQKEQMASLDCVFFCFLFPVMNDIKQSAYPDVWVSRGVQEVYDFLIIQL